MFNLPLDEAIEVFRHHYEKLHSFAGENDAHVRAVYQVLETGRAAPKEKEKPLSKLLTAARQLLLNLRGEGQEGST